jgi:hypothetical protein
MQKTKVTDFHEAIGQDMLEEPADTLDDIERCGSWACTSRLAVGEGDGAVCEAHEAAMGDGDPEDIRGEGCQGRAAIWMGLAMDIPGDVPDLRVDVLQQSGLAHGFFEEGAGDRGEGFDGDKAGGSGGEPEGAVL